MANFIRFLDKYDLHMINVDRVISIDRLIDGTGTLSIRFESGETQIFDFDDSAQAWAASNEIWEQLNSHD